MLSLVAITLGMYYKIYNLQQVFQVLEQYKQNL